MVALCVPITCEIWLKPRFDFNSLELNLPIPWRTWQEDHGWSSMKLSVELGSGLMNNHSANTELVSLAHAHGNLRSEHLTTWNFGWLLEIFGCVDRALEFCTWVLPESNWNIWCVLIFDWKVHLDNRQMLWFLSLSRNCLTIATGWDVLIIFLVTGTKQDRTLMRLIFWILGLSPEVCNTHKANRTLDVRQWSVSRILWLINAWLWC